MSEFSVFRVNSDGVRAAVCCRCYASGVSLERAKELSVRDLPSSRYVILDDAGVQVFASDERDSSGAYLPYGVA